mgnify:CR=1 FL=1
MTWIYAPDIRDLARNDKDLFLQGRSYRGFVFYNKKNNLKMTFQFQGKGYSNLIFGFHKSLNASNEKDCIEKFSTRYSSYKKSNQWHCYSNYEEFFKWSDLETLQKIQFGNFQSNLESKLSIIL